MRAFFRQAARRSTRARRSSPANRPSTPSRWARISSSSSDGTTGCSSTGAVRRDENSAFGADFGAAIYPKATVSWVAAENGAARWLNNLRLRGAFGESGQQPDVNAAFTYVAPVTASILGRCRARRDVRAFGGRLGNTDLKPERSREFELGFDFTTLHSRVNLQTTYYDKKTTDAIVQRDLAPSQTAGVNVFDNVGVVTNKGLEVSLNARVLEFTSFRYDLQVEASWNKNRLESLAPGVSPFGGFGYRNEPGQPLFAAYWPTMTGYSDANNNGVIEPSEVQVTSGSVFGGSTVPTRTISLNNTVGLFNDHLRLLGPPRLPRRIHDARGEHRLRCGLGPNNCRAIHDPKAPLLDQARAMAVGRALGAYWEKGDFIRVREIAAVYDLPQSVTRMRALALGDDRVERAGTWDSGRRTTSRVGSRDPHDGHGCDSLQLRAAGTAEDVHHPVQPGLLTCDSTHDKRDDWNRYMTLAAKRALVITAIALTGCSTDRVLQVDRRTSSIPTGLDNPAGVTALHAGVIGDLAAYTRRRGWHQRHCRAVHRRAPASVRRRRRSSSSIRAHSSNRTPCCGQSTATSSSSAVKPIARLMRSRK